MCAYIFFIRIIINLEKKTEKKLNKMIIYIYIYIDTSF
jgi:hypothetical protein